MVELPDSDDARSTEFRLAGLSWSRSKWAGAVTVLPEVDEDTLDVAVAGVGLLLLISLSSDSNKALAYLRM